MADACVVCLEQKTRLQRIRGTEKADKSHIKEKIEYTFSVDASSLLLSKICPVCVIFVEKCYDFKLKLKQKVTRSPKSPSGVTPKRRRISVIDSITKSLEKSHAVHRDTSSKGTKSVKKSLKFEDHAYSSVAAAPTFNDVPIATPEKMQQQQRRSPRKPVSDWLSETLSLCNDKDAVTHETKKAIITDHAASLNLLAFNGASIHFKKSPLMLSTWDIEPVIIEMKQHLPFLYCLLDALVGDSGSKSATISMIYGMIMHSRNKQASLMQRLLSTLLMKNNASNKLMTRLNKLHLTLTGDSKINLVREFGKFQRQQLLKDVSLGKDGKLNGDNVDIFVHTNDVRMNNVSKDYHFFATDWTPFRLDARDFHENTNVKNIVSHGRTQETSLQDFLVTDAEFDLFLDNFSVVLGRVMNANCSHFKWLKAVLPKHYQHNLSDVMTRKTTSHRLPILLKNEAKYADCIQIMDSYEQQVTEWYNRVARGWNVLDVGACHCSCWLQFAVSTDLCSGYNRLVCYYFSFQMPHTNTHTT